MNVHINPQIIKQNNIPAFAVIPYDEFLKYFPDKDNTVPHEVVGLIVKKGYNLVKAWRIYLKLTQKEVAGKADITQAAFSQMENSKNNLKTSTLEKLAGAMGLSIEQLTD